MPAKLTDPADIEAVLRFLVDSKSKKEAEQAIKSIAQPATQKSGKPVELFPDWQTAAAGVIDLSKSMGKSIAETSDAMANGFTLGGTNFNATSEQLQGAVVQFQEMQQAAQQAAAATKQAAKAANGLDKAAFGKNMLMGISGFTLAMTGTNMVKLSETISAPIDQYVKSMGQADDASRDWLSTTKDLEQANIRIGRALSSKVLPHQKLLADWAGKYATALEKNPLLASVVGGTSKALQGAGNVLQVGGGLLSAMASFKTLSLLAAQSGKTAASLTALAVSADAATAANTREALASDRAAAADTRAAFMKDPNIIKAVGKLANGQTGLGGLTSIFKGGMGKIGLPFGGTAAKATGAAATVGGASLAAFAGVLASVLGGVFAGIGIYNAGAKATGAQSAEEIIKKTLVIQAYASGWLVGGKAKASELALAMGKLTGTIEKTTTATNKLDVDWPQEALDSFIAFRKEELSAESDMNKQRISIIDDTSKQIQELEKSYAAERADIIRDFNKENRRDAEDERLKSSKEAKDRIKAETDYQIDYYAKRRKLLEEYSIDAQRAEEDHQTEMMNMLRAHNDRSADLIDQRDALGLWREERDHERERTAAEAEYSVEASRRSEDLARRLAEMENEFAQERAKRMQASSQKAADDAAEKALEKQRDMEDQKLKLADLEANHKEQVALAKTQEKESLIQLQKTYQEEKIKRNVAFFDQIRDLDANLLGESNRKKEWYEYQTRMLDAYVNQWKGKYSSGLPDYGTGKAPLAGLKGSRAGGGPVSEGAWWLHDDEWVLSGAQRDLLSNIIGNRGFTSASRSSKVELNQSFTFQGMIDDEMQKRIYQIAGQASEDGIIRAYRSVG